MNASTKPIIVAVHLINDFSGSPLIFKQALAGLINSGHQVVLHTAAGRDGFLSELEVDKKTFRYKFYRNTFIRLIAFAASQIQLFFQIIQYKNKSVIIYVNTLLPFGAALAAKLIGKKVVYHIHESYISPPLLKHFLKAVVKYSANYAIYVSKYLFDTENINGLPYKIVYNALPEEFVSIASTYDYQSALKKEFIVLMVCSLKEYKGVYNFVSLASRNEQLKFELVLNASKKEIKEYFIQKHIPNNLTIFDTQSNLHTFYCRASLVVNLTNPVLCIETFGMTILEAMAYGIPVIAPPIGGPTEIVESGINGFTIDARRNEDLDSTLNYLFTNQDLMFQLSKNAKITSEKFSSNRLKTEVCAIIDKL
jgi:glycosyltransferase involved in cell wall biosynthesis